MLIHEHLHGWLVDDSIVDITCIAMRRCNGKWQGCLRSNRSIWELSVVHSGSPHLPSSCSSVIYFDLEIIPGNKSIYRTDECGLEQIFRSLAQMLGKGKIKITLGKCAVRQCCCDLLNQPVRCWIPSHRQGSDLLQEDLLHINLTTSNRPLANMRARPISSAYRVQPSLQPTIHLNKNKAKAQLLWVLGNVNERNKN